LISNDENVLNKLPLEAPSDTISTEIKEKQIKKKKDEADTIDKEDNSSSENFEMEEKIQEG